MIIEGKAYNKYLKPKKGVSVDLRDHCLSLKLQADHPKEVAFLTALYNTYSPRGGRIVVYRGRKKIVEFTHPRVRR